MSLTEYVTFGSLRAGHRLQLKNLACGLSTLSMDQQSVVNLICTALWQAQPPRGDEGKQDDAKDAEATWLRDSHQDLHCADFAMEMLSVSVSVMDDMKENWKHHRKLLCVLCVVQRVLSLAPSEVVTTEAVKVLRMCRKIADDWALRMEATVSELAIAHTQSQHHTLTPHTLTPHTGQDSCERHTGAPGVPSRGVCGVV